MEGKTLNFVDEFSKLLTTYIDTPKIFADAAAFALTSTLIGPYFESHWVPHGTCNLFIVLSSIPGRTRRSTIQSAVEHVYKRVKKRQMIDTFRRDKKFEGASDEELNEAAEKFVLDTIIEEGTVEGLTDHIQDTPSKTFFIASKEFGEVFERIFRKGGYEQGVALIYSRLYYGEGSSVFLSGRKKGAKTHRTIPNGLYVTMLCGMQEFKLYVTEEAIRQGLARRLLIVYVQKSQEWLPPISEKRKNFNEELNKFADRLYDYIQHIQRALKHNQSIVFEANEMRAEENQLKIPETIDIIIRADVEDAINKFDKEMTSLLDENPTLENIALQSGWEHLFRLAACYEIAKPNCLHQLSSDEPYEVILQSDSYERARKFLDIIRSNTIGKIDSILDKKIQPRQIEDPVKRLYSIIKQHMPNGASRTQLLQRTQWESEDLDKCVFRLLELEEIVIENQPTKGRPKSIFKIKQKEGE